jgi:hypothetical protein
MTGFCDFGHAQLDPESICGDGCNITCGMSPLLGQLPACPVFVYSEGQTKR